MAFKVCFLLLIDRSVALRENTTALIDFDIDLRTLRRYNDLNVTWTFPVCKNCYKVVVLLKKALVFRGAAGWEPLLMVLLGIASKNCRVPTSSDPPSDHLLVQWVPCGTWRQTQEQIFQDPNPIKHVMVMKLHPLTFPPFYQDFVDDWDVWFTCSLHSFEYFPFFYGKLESRLTLTFCSPSSTFKTSQCQQIVLWYHHGNIFR